VAFTQVLCSTYLGTPIWQTSGMPDAHALTSWYKRSELGTKVALFFSSATVAGAFSQLRCLAMLCFHVEWRQLSGGLLATAIENMNGVAGKPGWAWIFILEGLFTVLCAVASFWMIQDFPEKAGFLSEGESQSEHAC
jgi:sugar phosphate permease